MLVYSINGAMNPSGSHVIIENCPGELTLHDLATGNTSAPAFQNGTAFVRFTLDGKKLFV